MRRRRQRWNRCNDPQKAITSKLNFGPLSMRPMTIFKHKDNLLAEVELFATADAEPNVGNVGDQCGAESEIENLEGGRDIETARSSLKQKAGGWKVEVGARTFTSTYTPDCSKITL